MRASESVIATLHRIKIPFAGRVIAVVGNRPALVRRRRYIARDLNRFWTPEHLDSLRRAEAAVLQDEDREQRDLLDVFGPLLDPDQDPVVFLDLHSTSGPGVPFVCMADVIRNRKLAFGLHIPVVLGLEEAIEGSMLGYLCDLGHIGIAVEGGQNDDPQTQRHHEASIWSVLVSAGALRPESIPGYEALRRGMEDAVRDMPKVIEIRHRHVVEEDEQFEMRPGYRSFQPVKAGERVARNADGDVRTPEAGLMMLPRYQGQGSDGYFLARPVRPFWLSLSARLRDMKADRLLPQLPGVTAHPEKAEHYLVDARVARRAIDIFHLLGFRREAKEGAHLVFSRRRPDVWGPEGLPDLSSGFEVPKLRTVKDDRSPSLRPRS